MHLSFGLATISLLLLPAIACHDSTATAPAIGQLALSMDGLPSGVKPSVLVTGPSSFRQVVDSNRTLAALPQGTFTVTALDVTAGSVRYAGAPATQTISVGGSAPASASQILYGIASARLAVNITGLPIGSAPSITLSGPKGFTRIVTANTQIDLLDPGTYIVTAADVTASGKVYRAVSSTQTIGLLASITPTITTIEYGAGSATLRIAINGLPFNVDGAVEVTGPNGFARHLTASASFGRLEAGSYTIAAAIVGSVLTTNNPSPEKQTLTLTGSDTLAASVTYSSTPPQLAAKLVVDGLTQPVYLTAPEGDARQFIVERGGRVKLLINGVVQATPFLDISSRVNNVGERGMLSMTFDPAYATNGYVYVFYVGLNGNVIVERIASTPGANVAGASAGIVISIPHGGSEHHGGMIAFGPDGMLYLAPGDGGCCGDPKNNAQNLGIMLGKILRLDVRSLPYKVPADNPFLTTAGALPEIWAYGLRNPWRFAFDPTSSMLFIGDVGQDAYEEVDAVSTKSSGINYGWPFTEGNACYNPTVNCTAGRSLTLPVIDYPHSDGCSVIGGFVYRGAAIPELTGHYLYADFCKGWLRSFQLVGGRVSDTRNWSGVSLPFTSSFGRDGAGELYLIGGTKIWKLVRQGS